MEQLFYCPQVSKYTTLSQEESHYCIKVLRFKTGNTIYITDGKGRLFEAKILKPDPKATSVETHEIKHIDCNKKTFAVALALLKKEKRYEWFVEKATELGANYIIPFTSKYTEKQNIRHDRLEKIAISAIKQSLQLCLPKILNPVPLEQLPSVAEQLNISNRFLALCHAKTKLSQMLSNQRNILITIGPEGGFSNDEIQFLSDNNFHPVLLSNTRLRAETAAISACSIINLALFV
jgi:16S rRNA (uracil1498-N3)-methyltransferase